MRTDKFGAEYHRLRRQKIREAGLCLRCRQPKGELRLGNQFCAPCDLADQRGEANYVEREQTYAGYRDCVRCKEMGITTNFWSDDKRSITRCPECRDWMNDMEDSLICDMHRFDLGAGRGWEEVREKTTSHIGRMTGEKQRQRMGEIHEQDVQGIVCRRLSPEEIAQQYPQDRLDSILEQCERNARSMYGEMGEVKQL